jgi:type IV secretory pathway VirB2 component (pilin)
MKRVNQKRPWLRSLVAAGTGLLYSASAYCSVESSLTAVQSKFINVILPMVGVLGIVWATFSLVMGHADAKKHVIWAAIGVGIGFGAPSIIDMIRGMIQ